MKKILGSAIAAASVALSVSAANAVDFNRSATVNIERAAIASDAGAEVQLDFGTLVKPSAGNTSTFVLDTNGTMTSANGTFSGTPQVGSFTFTGDTTQTVSISLTPGTPPAGIGLGLTAAYDSGSETVGSVGSVVNLASQAALGNGKTLLVGGTIELADNAAAGSQTVDYTIAVNYD